MSTSIEYLISRGVVSESCLPYTSDFGACTYTCADEYADYTKYYCKRGSLKALTDWEAVKEELMTKGPMMVAFTVYKDFMTYGSGVYSPTTSEKAGGHAVKLIGWGTAGDGSLYWVCQN